MRFNPHEYDSLIDEEINQLSKIPQTRRGQRNIVHEHVEDDETLNNGDYNFNYDDDEYYE